MTSYFIGGAAGSLASAWAYGHWGWTGVVLVGRRAASPASCAWALPPARHHAQQHCWVPRRQHLTVMVLHIALGGSKVAGQHIRLAGQ
jgi:hypothetical protein